MILEELEYLYNISIMFTKEEIINKIIEFECDRELMDDWLEENL